MAIERQSQEFVHGAIYVLDYLSMLIRNRKTEVGTVPVLELISALRRNSEFIDQRVLNMVENDVEDD
jgi:hypothetical protein